MTADYVIPDCPGEDPGGDWREMGWDTHHNAAYAHLAWCPNHAGYQITGPDEWACRACFGVTVGTSPEDMLCAACRGPAAADESAGPVHNRQAIHRSR